MVRIEQPNKLIIEIEGSDPESLYSDLLKEITNCVMAAQADKINDDVRDSTVFVLELLKALHPTDQQVSRIFSRD